MTATLPALESIEAEPVAPVRRRKDLEQPATSRVVSTIDGPPGARRHRRHSAADTTTSWTPAKHLAPLVVALGLWVTGLKGVDLRTMTDLGLVSALPLPYWLGLGIILVSLAVLIHGGRASTPVLLAYFAALIMVIHGTPAILYHSLRYGWAWKHVGIIDYILTNHRVDPNIAGLFSAYHAWPGFFALNALIVKMSGLGSALSYAAWGPPFFELLALAPLRMLFATLTRDKRQAWLALLIFYLSNMVGQDYFSPQAFAFLLYLVIVALCLRWLRPVSIEPLPRWRRWLGSDLPAPEPTPPALRRMVLSVVIVLMVAIVSSHQLTPFMLISALTLLVLGRQIGPRWLPWLLGAMTFGWIAMTALTFLSHNLYWIVQSIGHPDSNTQTGFVDLSNASLEQRIVAYSARGLAGGLGLLAGYGWLRLRRLGLPRGVPALLAVSPALMILVNNYGGEMLFRVYLFALPFLALMAAAAVYPTSGSRAGRHRPASRVPAKAPIIIALVLVVPFSLAYYGRERANYFSPQEVAASTWLYANAPDRSLILAPSAAFPWAWTHYWTYDYAFLEDLKPMVRSRLDEYPLSIIDQTLEQRRGPAYIVVMASQAYSVQYSGLLPHNAIATISRDLDSSPDYRVVFHNRDATIYELTTGVRFP